MSKPPKKAKRERLYSFDYHPEHKAQLKEWNDKRGIAVALDCTPMDDDDREICRAAVQGMYEAAGLVAPPPERIVFASSPLVARLAGGFAAAIWWLRKNPDSNLAKMTVSDATSDATRNATHIATRIATDAAPHYATSDATGDATSDATRNAMDNATRIATDAATSTATYNATSDATDNATSDATDNATDDATYNATDAATYNATSAATDNATHDATSNATHIATYNAASNAPDDATYNATHIATHIATSDATRIATRIATHYATSIATRNATDDATSGATRNAMDKATHDATDAATHIATRIATDAATSDATSNATGNATYNAASNAPDIIDQLSSEEKTLVEFFLKCAKSSSNMWQGGNEWAGWGSYLSFFRDIAKLDLPEYQNWKHWEALELHSGIRIVHKDFCIISDRPEYIKMDEQNRPHCIDGPFKKYRDGWSLYCINGVPVEREMTER